MVVLQGHVEVTQSVYFRNDSSQSEIASQVAADDLHAASLGSCDQSSTSKETVSTIELIDIEVEEIQFVVEPLDTSGPDHVSEGDESGFQKIGGPDRGHLVWDASHICLTDLRRHDFLDSPEGETSEEREFETDVLFVIPGVTAERDQSGIVAKSPFCSDELHRNTGEVERSYV